MSKWLIGLFSVSIVYAAGIAPDRVRETAAKAVGSIQRSQKNWYAKQTCYSCHHQVLPAMAFTAAREHGVPVDEAAAHADAAAGFGFLANFARAVEYTHMIDPTLGDGNGLLGA
jgi:hypothetical protein